MICIQPLSILNNYLLLVCVLLSLAIHNKMSIQQDNTLRICLHLPDVFQENKAVSIFITSMQYDMMI